MTAPSASVFVCTTCRRRIADGDGDEAFDRPGSRLAAALADRLVDDPSISVTAIDCLAVCKRPCTVALAADAKWTYLVGDLDPATHIDEIESAVRAFAASDNGIVPWKERPQTFRKGVIARVPPVGFKYPEAAE